MQSDCEKNINFVLFFNEKSAMKKLSVCICLLIAMNYCNDIDAAGIEKIKYGNFDSWVTRNIHESAVIGGNTKTLYEVGPTQTNNGNKAYVNLGGSPWATSNVYAKVSGVVKGSNAVYPAVRSGANKCARLASQMEHVKALGFINMDVMVAGSMFLGQMLEPISSTKNPYSKMIMGVPYTKKPKALVFDYKLEVPANNTRTKSSGFGSKKTLPGRDNAVVFVFLQSRWEDAKGNLHAKRVATGGKKFGSNTGWVNGFRLPLTYGAISASGTDSWLGLRNASTAYYARNSKGKMRPVIEDGFDANAAPTHVIVMFSAGSGEPYVGTEGLTFYVDNVGFQL